jgi:carbon monoxide dehydrogenase subunit G
VRIGSSFEVPAADDEVWALLRDVPRVVSCMPGAELIETIDDSTWKTKMSVKLGPMTLGFTADVKREDADEAARRVRLSAKARELRGRGGAGATVESTLTELGSGTRVSVVTDLTLVSRFADCLREQLESVSPEGRAAATTPATPRPVSGLSLLLRAIGRTIGGAIRRLAKRGPGA